MLRTRGSGSCPAAALLPAGPERGPHRPRWCLGTDPGEAAGPEQHDGSPGSAVTMASPSAAGSRLRPPPRCHRAHGRWLGWDRGRLLPCSGAGGGHGGAGSRARPRSAGSLAQLLRSGADLRRRLLLLLAPSPGPRGARRLEPLQSPPGGPARFHLGPGSDHAAPAGTERPRRCGEAAGAGLGEGGGARGQQGPVIAAPGQRGPAGRASRPSAE